MVASHETSREMRVCQHCGSALSVMVTSVCTLVVFSVRGMQMFKLLHKSRFAGFGLNVLTALPCVKHQFNIGEGVSVVWNSRKIIMTLAISTVGFGVESMSNIQLSVQPQPGLKQARFCPIELDRGHGMGWNLYYTTEWETCDFNNGIETRIPAVVQCEAQRKVEKSMKLIAMKLFGTRKNGRSLSFSAENNVTSLSDVFSGRGA